MPGEFRVFLIDLMSAKAFHNNKLVAGGRIVSVLNCFVGSLSFESGILPLLKHTYGEQ